MDPGAPGDLVKRRARGGIADDGKDGEMRRSERHAGTRVRSQRHVMEARAEPRAATEVEIPERGGQLLEGPSMQIVAMCDQLGGAVAQPLAGGGDRLPWKAFIAIGPIDRN